IVIEEEHDSNPAGVTVPAKAAASRVELQKPRRKLAWPSPTSTIVIVVTLTLALGGAVLLQRRWAGARAVLPAARTPMRTVPLTSFPDDELDPALSPDGDRKSTRLNSSHVAISYAVFCLKKKNETLLD